MAPTTDTMKLYCRCKVLVEVIRRSLHNNNAKSEVSALGPNRERGRTNMLWRIIQRRKIQPFCCCKECYKKNSVVDAANHQCDNACGLHDLGNYVNKTVYCKVRYLDSEA